MLVFLVALQEILLLIQPLTFSTFLITFPLLVLWQPEQQQPARRL
jgi:hypothetical protein